jgi:hypothetical protein
VTFGGEEGGVRKKNKGRKAPDFSEGIILIHAPDGLTDERGKR